MKQELDTKQFSIKEIRNFFLELNKVLQRKKVKFPAKEYFGEEDLSKMAGITSGSDFSRFGAKNAKEFLKLKALSHPVSKETKKTLTEIIRDKDLKPLLPCLRGDDYFISKRKIVLHTNSGFVSGNMIERICDENILVYTHSYQIISLRDPAMQDIEDFNLIKGMFSDISVFDTNFLFMWAINVSYNWKPSFAVEQYLADIANKVVSEESSKKGQEIQFNTLKAV